MQNVHPPALLSFSPWSHAIRAMLMAGVFCGGIWGIAATKDNKLTEQLHTLIPNTLAAMSCVLVARASAWSCRWSIYPDRIERHRLGIGKTDLPFRSLEAVNIRVDDEDRRHIAAAVTTSRRRLDGEIPAIFHISMRGKDSTGMPVRLVLSSADFNRHDEARRALSHILEHSPRIKRHMETQANNTEGLLRVIASLMKWTLLFLGFLYLWDQLYQALGC